MKMKEEEKKMKEEENKTKEEEDTMKLPKLSILLKDFVTKIS